MKRSKWILILLVCVSLGSKNLCAQYSELGLTLGGATYEGDLAPAELATYLETYRPAFGLFYRYHLNDRLAVRADLRRLTIYGDDALSNRSRDINFTTPITEFSVSGELSLFNLYLGNSSVYLSPYGHLGVGVFYFNPKTTFQGQEYELQPIGTEGQGLMTYGEPYQRTQFMIPMGGGVKLVIDDRWVIGMEGNFRWTNTDYLDDVSSTDLNYRDILVGNGTLAAQLSRPDLDPATTDATNLSYRRGGPAKDYYFMAVVSISIFIDGWSPFGGGGRRGMGCPTNF